MNVIFAGNCGCAKSKAYTCKFYEFLFLSRFEQPGSGPTLSAVEPLTYIYVTINASILLFHSNHLIKTYCPANCQSKDKEEIFMLSLELGLHILSIYTISNSSYLHCI